MRSKPLTRFGSLMAGAMFGMGIVLPALLFETLDGVSVWLAAATFVVIGVTMQLKAVSGLAHYESDRLAAHVLLPINESSSRKSPQ